MFLKKKIRIVYLFSLFYFKSQSIDHLECQSPTVALNTWATQNHVLTKYILLNEQYLPPANNRPHVIFSYRLYIGHDLYFDGHGSSHQRARTECAYHALNFIHQNQILHKVSTPADVNIFFISLKKKSFQMFFR